MLPRVMVLRADHDAAFESLWRAADDQRRRQLNISAKRPPAPSPSTATAFGVGAFDGEALVAGAVAVPARADDGGSQRIIAGLAHISRVATRPGREGEGLGGLVVRAVMWNALRLGYSRAQLWTHAANSGAQRLYEREGFTLSGRHKTDDSGEAIVHYIRELPAPQLVLGRAAARVLCLDSEGRVLLMHWRHPLTGHQLWEPPGGGIEAAETSREAVLREWREETGLAAPTLVGEPTTVGRDVLWGDARFVGDEVYFLGRYDAGPTDVATAFTAVEQASYLGQEWVHWRDLDSTEWRGDLIDPDLMPVLRRLDPSGPVGCSPTLWDMSDAHRDMDNLGFETLAIHAGQPADPATGAVMTPIFANSTYKQDGVGGLRGGYEYSRTGNPTRRALEDCLAALEHGARGIAFASGMAAEDALIRVTCRPGDHVVIPHDAYGGTYRLFETVFKPWGLDHTPASEHHTESIAAAVQPGRTKLVWIETPSNPLLGVADIEALAGVAHDAGALLVVDNTFATPYLQQPITLGADVVVHSTTKYAGGHSDVVGGAVVTADADLGQRIAVFQNSTGAIAGPFDAYLVLRGLKTLGVRMDRHCDNAERIVDFLVGHDAVSQVFYPGLPEHSGHGVAGKQMRRYGGMVSFRARAGHQAALDVCNQTRLFTLAESLGGVESLIELPATMTHASVAESPLAVPDDLVRLSVGIETVDDLISDLAQALR